MKKIIGIILSGGDSSRMGSPKALLACRGKTFLEHCIDALTHGGILKILVITGSAHDEIMKHVDKHSLPCTLIRNPHPDEGQYSSLQTALHSLPDNTDAVIVHLVDHPLVKKETIDAIVRKYISTTARMIIPSCEHRRGHPVLYGSTLFQEIITTFPEQGARSIIELHQQEIVYVEVDDPGIKMNIDTKEDLEKYCT